VAFLSSGPRLPAGGPYRTALLRRIRRCAVLRSDAPDGRHRHSGEQGHGSDHDREAGRPNQPTFTGDTASTSTSSRSPMYRTTTMSASPPLSMHHSRNCNSAFSNGTIWFWPRSSETTIKTAPMSLQLPEGQDSISTCFARATSRSSGQSLAGRNAKTSRSSSGSRSSRKRGSASRVEGLRLQQPAQ
jgi:hypothetical protein